MDQEDKLIFVSSQYVRVRSDFGALAPEEQEAVAVGDGGGKDGLEDRGQGTGDSPSSAATLHSLNQHPGSSSSFCIPPSVT